MLFTFFFFFFGNPSTGLEIANSVIPLQRQSTSFHGNQPEILLELCPNSRRTKIIPGELPAAGLLNRAVVEMESTGL